MAWLEGLMDNGTLVFVNVSLGLVSGLTLLCVWLGRRSERSLLLWALSNIVFTAGFGLLTWPIQWDFGAVLANGLVDAGTAVAYLAVWLFLKRPRRELWPVAVAGAMYAVEFGLFLGRGFDFHYMTPLGCGLRALLTVAAGWLLIRHAERSIRTAANLSAVFHFLWAVMLVARIGWALMPKGVTPEWDPTGPAALMFRIILTFVITPSYLWMLTRQLDADLIRQAGEDPLTGIANRRVMWDAGRKGVADGRQRKRGFCVLMLDVDHFKSVNDTWGHDAGDRVLVEVARALQTNVRAGDLVARVGGEEFMVLMSGTDAQTALEIAERLRLAVQSLVFPMEGGATLRCTISAGLGTAGDEVLNWDDLVTTADRALYRAKHGGRNQVNFQALAA